MKKILVLLLIFTSISCRNKVRNYEINSSQDSSYNESESGYSDGTYCAEVEYYYSNTGTRSTYTLEVEIEDNELIVIHWPNGGWLDDSHFYPPDISDGSAEFESDNGVEYTVEIIGQGGGCNLSNYAPSESGFLEDEEEEEYDWYDDEETENSINKGTIAPLSKRELSQTNHAYVSSHNLPVSA